jgi:hypothetical protein
MSQAAFTRPQQVGVFFVILLLLGLIAYRSC